MIDRFNKQLNKIFGSYKKIDKIMELREEMLGALMDRYDELKSQGLSDEESFTKSLEILDGITDTIDILEEENTQPIPQDPISKYFLPALAYWLVLIVVFLGVSLGTGRWDVTWMIVVGGALLFGAVVGGVLFKVSREKGMKLLSRSNLLIASMFITTAAYLVWSFATSNWQYTWVTFLLGVMIWYAIDMIVRKNNKGIQVKVLDVILLTVLATVVIYIIASFLSGAWAMTWLAFVIMALAIIVELMIFSKKQTH